MQKVGSRETVACTHVKARVSPGVHPSNHHVRLRHLSVGRQSEADPSRGPHAHGESDVLRLDVKVPVERVVTSFQLGGEAVGLAEVVRTVRHRQQRSQYEKSTSHPI